eukprot:5290248-Prymnesium_polylepis.1
MTNGMTRELGKHQQELINKVPVGPQVHLFGILPKVYLEITVDNRPLGRIEIMLRTDVVPQTCENFRLLCTGEMGRSEKTGKLLSYKGCPFHRAKTRFMLEGGDISKKDGATQTAPSRPPQQPPRRRLRRRCVALSVILSPCGEAATLTRAWAVTGVVAQARVASPSMARRSRTRTSSCSTRGQARSTSRSSRRIGSTCAAPLVRGEGRVVAALSRPVDDWMATNALALACVRRTSTLSSA